MKASNDLLAAWRQQQRLDSSDFVAVGGGDVAVFLFAALPLFCAPP